MAQQTAVEWLMLNIEKTLPNFIEAWRVEYEQAKQMEKEQIVKAYSNGSNDRLKNRINDQYYNETFGNK